MAWMRKSERERLELETFLRQYPGCSNGRQLTLVRYRDKPDFELKEEVTGKLVGLETTAAFESNDSVPRLHLGEYRGLPPYDPERIARYLDGLVRVVKRKILDAQIGYDRYPEMILSVYVADDFIIYMHQLEEWVAFVRQNEDSLSNCAPFTEVVFVNLPNHWAISIRP
jgi:hypothetical protein